MVLLLEATRRAIGLPLVCIAVLFIIFSLFGQQMPDLIAHAGLSITRLVGYHWLSGEAIFGIPISVSVSFIFLFVLFGSILDAAGGGKYFLNLAFALVGKMRGGPAKAAILASGLTGMISGSSVANTVTTGTFTIPIMKKTGLPAVKAGAIEVAASVNGQIMPPIMGAAAFVMAELLGIPYLTVVTHAFLPAVISYIALFYISHIEALKLDLKGLPEKDIPPLKQTFLSGIHFLIPIGF
jgi:TRAP transporter 4TM/12TM fusion protein